MPSTLKSTHTRRPLWALLFLLGCVHNLKDSGPGSTDLDCDTPSTWYPDTDGDGFGDSADSADSIESCSGLPGYVDNQKDCNDDNDDINPDADEVCDQKATDEDCDGLVNGQDDDVTGLTTWYADADGDGYGDPNKPFQSCNQPSGYVDNNDDTDDSTPSG